MDEPVNISIVRPVTRNSPLVVDVESVESLLEEARVPLS